MKSIISIILTICIIIPSAVRASGDLYLIYGQPGSVQINKRPYETTIFELDEDELSIKKVWSIGENIQTKNIKTYYSVEKIMISEGEIHINKLHIIDFDDINNSYSLELAPIGRVINYRYISVNDGKDQLRILYRKGVNYKKTPQRVIRINVDGTSLVPKNVPVKWGEIRLSGARSNYGGGESEGAFVNRDSLGFLWSPDEDINDFGGISLPDSVIRIRHNRGLGVNVFEPKFLVLGSVPVFEEKNRREIYIYNRIDSSWNSMIVMGARTSPRLINNWLVGIIAYPDAESRHYPSALTENFVLINPLEASQFTVYLGKNAEILWIENTDVYYRLDDSLYKARIENNDFVDRQLLLTDPRIKHIHWAFRGKSRQE